MRWNGIPFEWIAALPLVGFAAGGCCTPGTGRVSAINKEREKEADERAAKELEKTAASASKLTARSQAPNPITPVEGRQPDPVEADVQVKVVANVGNQPVYDREVREMVAQRVTEYMDLRGAAQEEKKKKLYAEELKRLVERELIIEDLMSKVKKSKNENAQKDLKDTAAKEADRRLKEFRLGKKIETEEEFVKILESQGLTLTGLKRQLERDTMKSIYLGELLKPKMNAVSLADLHDYYDTHDDEFKVAESIKWMDLFISASKFADKAEARKYADTLLVHVKAGADFAALVKQYDHGDSKFRDGYGTGECKGEIRPADVEPTVLALKTGAAAMVEMESGYHIVKVAEHTSSGKKPFDEKTQAEIRRKLVGLQYEREYQRLVDGLWRKAQPQIYGE